MSTWLPLIVSTAGTEFSGGWRQPYERHAEQAEPAEIRRVRKSVVGGLPARQIAEYFRGSYPSAGGWKTRRSPVTEPLAVGLASGDVARFGRTLHVSDCSRCCSGRGHLGRWEHDAIADNRDRFRSSSKCYVQLLGTVVLRVQDDDVVVLQPFDE
jgi:hypothetical protein